MVDRAVLLLDVIEKCFLPPLLRSVKVIFDTLLYNNHSENH